MASDELIEQVREHVAAITPLLDEAMAYAVYETERRNSGISHKRFGFVRSGQIKVFARLFLEDGRLPDNWSTTGNPSLQGQLKITLPGVMDLRFLKASSVQPDGVPHAGHSQNRRALWNQDPLPSLEFFEGNTVQKDHNFRHFLLLWDYLDADERLEGTSLRLVHPISAGAYKRQVKCDLDIDIPSGGTDFSDLKFPGQDEEEDLFAIDIDETEKELGS